MSRWLLQHSRSIAHTNTEANPGEEADVAGTAEEGDPVGRQAAARRGGGGGGRGAEAGIVPTPSLVSGVAAAAAARSTILVAGLAGLVAGAMSMAAGEYVSGSSPRGAQRPRYTRDA